MNIHITLVAYALADDLLYLFGALNGEDVTWHLFLHSQHADVVQACEAIAARENVCYYPYGVNRGLAKSWNEGLLASQDMGADVMLIANDDTMATRGDLDRIVAAALERRDCYLISGMGLDISKGSREDMLLALAAINPVALATVGMFDENFFPIYYEDIDYYRRAALSGLEHYVAPDTTLKHAGSKTLRVASEVAEAHEHNFALNQQWYMAKWGGDKGAEMFDAPFGGAYGLYIAPEDRHNPYPGYRRE